MVYLRPGTPDDENREYLPEAIKGSDIVVNENGNNSIPYPWDWRSTTEYWSMTANRTPGMSMSRTATTRSGSHPLFLGCTED